MQNTYQDLITAVQNKNPAKALKLEGGKKFQMKTDFKPAGDQPEAIKQLVNGANKDQVKPGFTWCHWIWKNFYNGKGY